MAAKNILLLLVVLQCFYRYTHGMCDQRRFGGELKCCTSKKDTNCFVRMNADRRRGNGNKICYCDDYCKFTNDCCKDAVKARKLCLSQARDCKVSAWQPWGKCSANCGIGFMKRTRRILQFPENGGEACPVLRQTRGCNINKCSKNKHHAAIVLPINFRREKFGDYGYENILPAIKENQADNNVQADITKPTYSYCVHYRLSYKRKSCDNSWAASFQKDVPVCVECQSRVMNGGHCRGEGAIGVRTRWRALGVARCHGNWIRLGEIIPNCTCNEKQFTNFVFV